MNPHLAPMPDSQFSSKTTALMFAFITDAITNLVLSQLPWQQQSDKSLRTESCRDLSHN